MRMLHFQHSLNFRYKSGNIFQYKTINKHNKICVRDGTYFFVKKGDNVKKFRHLTYGDRVAMETLLNRGSSKADVARYLDVSRATITREYKKGMYKHTTSELVEIDKYSADLAQSRADYANTSKGRPLKLGNDIEFSRYIEDKIVKGGYSPAVALEMARREGFKTDISVNTLYRYIDAHVFLKLSNKNLSIKGKKKHHGYKRKLQKRMSAGQSIEKRPSYINDREEFGHWEMDTVKGKKGISRSCLLVLTERKTRMEIVRKMPTQGASSVVAELDSLEQELGGDFGKLFKTITVDNGVEFSDYEGMRKSKIHEGSRTEVYYCHAYSSYERGSNENANKLIRRHVPKGHDTDKVSNRKIQYVQDWINDLPRKLLNWRTSRQLFNEELEKLCSKG